MSDNAQPFVFGDLLPGDMIIWNIWRTSDFNPPVTSSLGVRRIDFIISVDIYEQSYGTSTYEVVNVRRLTMNRVVPNTGPVQCVFKIDNAQWNASWSLGRMTVYRGGTVVEGRYDAL